METNTAAQTLRLATSSFEYFILTSVVQFFNSAFWLNLVALLKALALLAVLGLAGGSIVLIIKLNIIGQKLGPLKAMLKKPGVQKKPELVKALKAIKARIEKRDAEEDRQAIILASQLLERALASLGHKENSLRANLEAVPAWSKVTIDEILNAQSLRIKIIHYPTEPISHAQAEKAVETIEKALQDLGVV